MSARFSECDTHKAGVQKPCPTPTPWLEMADPLTAKPTRLLLSVTQRYILGPPQASQNLKLFSLSYLSSICCSPIGIVDMKAGQKISGTPMF